MFLIRTKGANGVRLDPHQKAYMVYCKMETSLGNFIYLIKSEKDDIGMPRHPDNILSSTKGCQILYKSSFLDSEENFDPLEYAWADEFFFKEITLDNEKGVLHLPSLDDYI